jgi:type IV fimbrial biogenesis protein FimT
LESVMRTAALLRPTDRGLTMIELAVAMAVVAILLTVAVGGFGGLFARKRAEGVASDVGTDLQYARGEAVARNQTVRVTLGTDCYGIHTVGTSAGSCTAAGTGGTMIKQYALSAGTNATMTRVPGNQLAYIEFDPVRGTARGWQSDGTTEVAEPGLLVGSTAGSWSLRVRALLSGRVEICVPSGSTMAGYRSC